jgi:hypothetical protein
VSRNGALPAELRDRVREALADGGMPAVAKELARVGDGSLVRPALAFANEACGALYTDDELAEVADGGADDAIAYQQELRRQRARRDARRALAAEAVTVPEFPTGTLADDLATPAREQRYLVDELCPKDGNVVFVGQFKAGKTAALMGLGKALADGEPYLGFFDTHLEGRVAYLNYELDADMFRAWLRDVGVRNTDRVTAPFHLRGRSLPFWTKPVHSGLVEWLQANDVGVLILDPAARAWRPLVEEENSNSQMAAFTEAVDELKHDAGIREVVIATHTGRGVQLEDNERARGATRLEDWMDAGWYLSKDKQGMRWFRATGRDVDVEAVALDWDAGTRQMHFTGTTRADERRRSQLLSVLEALAEMEAAGGDDYPAKLAPLRTRMHGEKAGRDDAIRKAVDGGYVKVTKGAKNALLHEFTKRGRTRLAKAGDES